MHALCITVNKVILKLNLKKRTKMELILLNMNMINVIC